MIKMRHIFFATFYFLLTLILSGCKLAILDPKGMIAADEKHILIISVLLMLVVVIPVIFLTLFFAWRYRASNTQATYSPNWAHSTKLEIILWTVPCVIVAILGTITWISSFQLDPYKQLAAKEKTLTIQAVALEWKWLFIYPEQNFATVNFVQFPVGVPVEFLITAEGPMNSFQIPQLGGQIYAMAGMQTKLHLIADTLGDYRGVSANFSGEGFSDMQFNVRVSSKEQFEQWVKTAKQSSEKLNVMAYNKLVIPSKNEIVKYFSSANKNIFNTIVMKSMMPMPSMANKKSSDA